MTLMEFINQYEHCDRCLYILRDNALCKFGDQEAQPAHKKYLLLTQENYDDLESKQERQVVSFCWRTLNLLSCGVGRQLVILVFSKCFRAGYHTFSTLKFKVKEGSH